MGWYLFIDDDARTPNLESWRYPPNQLGWKIAVSTEEAQALVETFGVPSLIDFDHDLGPLPDGTIDTSMRFLKWLSEEYPDAIKTIEDYKIHSQNPTGAKNIQSFMESWRRSMEM